MHADDPDLVAYCSKVAAEYRYLYVLFLYQYRNHFSVTWKLMIQDNVPQRRCSGHRGISKIWTQRIGRADAYATINV